MSNGTANATLVMLPTLTLWQREVIRFLRQRSRIIGALGTPVVFWLLVGSGLRNSFSLGENGANFLQYAFPGAIIMIVLFTAIFSTISVIQDRREGFMQAVLAAPVSRAAIVLGKVLGSTTLALIQAVLFMLLAPLVGLPLTPISFVLAVLVLFVVSLGLSGLGFLIAWSMESIQGFHAIMNLFLMPMWLLSGALFPASGAAAWIRWIMAVNPLTYGVASLRYALYWGEGDLGAGLPSPAVAGAVTVGFTVVMVALCAKAVADRE